VNKLDVVWGYSSDPVHYQAPANVFCRNFFEFWVKRFNGVTSNVSVMQMEPNSTLADIFEGWRQMTEKGKD
jgi:hypothetical protein